MQYATPTTIETERLILKMFKEPDWKDIHELYSDPECVKYTVRQPFKESETWQKIASFLGHWQLRGYGLYAIEEKLSTKVAGFAGPYYPIDWPEPEIQWSLSRMFWGKGYASEAVVAIKKMLTEYLPEISFISIIHPGNENSKKLAKKLNCVYEKDFFFKDDTWNIYRHI